MSKRVYWGLGVLIVLLIGASVFLLMRNTDTDPIVVYKGDVELSKEVVGGLHNKVSKDNPPHAEPGYKWVWHDDHWDKVKIDEVNQPIKHQDIQISDFSNEMPAENFQISEKPDTRVDEDFYRENFSREELAANLKSFKEVHEQLQNIHIPQYEEFRIQCLKHLQINPDSEYYKKYLGKVEETLKRYKAELERGKKMNEMISNVLNEEGNHVEK